MTVQGEQKKARRWRRFVELVVVALGAVLLTLVILNGTIRDTEVRACERTSERDKQFLFFIEDAVETRREDGDYATAREYQQRADKARSLLPDDCNNVTNNTFPFID